MGEERARRPWFQLHLSTAIVLMFAAGGIIWANTIRCPGENPNFQCTYHGFPFHCGARGSAPNVLAGTVLLFVTGVACEAYTRRRWRFWQAAALVAAVLWLPLSLFLADLASTHVRFRSETLICQGWPRPSVYWQRDGAFWSDFPVFSGIMNVPIVFALSTAGLLASVAVLYGVERLATRVLRHQREEKPPGGDA